MSSDYQKVCFVCETPLLKSKYSLNKNVMLPVCAACKGTEAELKKEAELIDSLGDGQICGCI